MKSFRFVLLVLALCASSRAAEVVTRSMEQRVMLAYIADTFANKGFVQADPFAPSPTQMMEIDSQIKDLITSSMAQHVSDAAVSQDSHAEDEPANDPVFAEIKESIHAMVEEKDQEEQPQAPELLETEAEIEANKENKGLVNTAKGAAKSIAKVANKAKDMLKKGAAMFSLGGSLDKFSGAAFEDCMACRFIWKQVEMDVANAKYIEDVQASFEHNCLDAQKSTIFYKACEDMYDDMYAMTDDYMSSDYTVDKMCQRANMCKK